VFPALLSPPVATTTTVSSPSAVANPATFLILLTTSAIRVALQSNTIIHPPNSVPLAHQLQTAAVMLMEFFPSVDALQVNLLTLTMECAIHHALAASTMIQYKLPAQAAVLVSLAANTILLLKFSLSADV
jgi:hypothetical protein